MSEEYCATDTNKITRHTEQYPSETQLCCVYVSGSGNSSVRNYFTWTHTSEWYNATRARPLGQLHPHCCEINPPQANACEGGQRWPDCLICPQKGRRQKNVPQKFWTFSVCVSWWIHLLAYMLTMVVSLVSSTFLITLHCYNTSNLEKWAREIVAQQCWKINISLFFCLGPLLSLPSSHGSS